MKTTFSPRLLSPPSSMEITHPTGTVFTKIYFFRQQKEVGVGGRGGVGGTRVRTICLLQSSCLGKFQLSMYSSFILINLTYFLCPLIYYPINSLTFQYLWSAPHAYTQVFYGMIFPNRHLNVQS